MRLLNLINSNNLIMDEPWYQTNGPSSDEIIKDMITIFGENNKKIIINTLETLHPNKAFGSYRGYATFIRTPLVSAINTSLNSKLKSLPE